MSKPLHTIFSILEEHIKSFLKQSFFFFFKYQYVGFPVSRSVTKSLCKYNMKWLVKNGVDRKRLQTKSYGSSRPLATNDDEKEGRELNRRIEIVVIE